MAPREKRTDLGPATPSLAHERQAEAVRIVRDVLAGTMRLRQRAREYLPRFPKEADEIYEMRRSTSVLFNATKRTIKAFVGMVFRKDLTLSEDIDETVQEHFENIDLTGRSLSTFAQAHFEDAEADGHAVIFVDMQPPAEADNLADEIAAGLRPYWLSIQKQDVLGFSTENVGGATVLTNFRYHQVITERDGYKEIEVHRIREYFIATEDDGPRRVGFRVWRLDPDKEYPGESAEDWSLDGEEGRMSRSTIPVAVTYTNRDGYLESTPPFLDLALDNIRHFQTDSDNQNLARTAKVQTLVFKGESEDRIKGVAVGPGSAILLESAEADAKYIGADGTSYSVFLDDLTKQEQRMAVMGLSQLMSESRAAETAQSKRIDKAESDSQLAASAKNHERALNDAYRIHCEWLDVEPKGQIGVNTDFETEPLDSATFREFRELWAERGISWRTLMAIAEKGDLLPEGFDADEEEERIAEETAAALDREMALMDGGREGDEEGNEETEEEAA